MQIVMRGSVANGTVPLNRYLVYSMICPILGSLRKIHRYVNKMKTTNQLKRLSKALFEFSIRLRRGRSIARISPCNAPHNANDHAAPCHNPDKIMTTSVFANVRTGPFRLPPRGKYR